MAPVCPLSWKVRLDWTGDRRMRTRLRTVASLAAGLRSQERGLDRLRGPFPGTPGRESTMSALWYAFRRSSRSLGAPALTILSLLISLSLAERAFASSCTSTKAFSRAQGTSVGLRVPAGAPVGLLEDAVEIWDRCRDFGFAVPDLWPGSEGSQDLVVLYRPTGNVSRRCGLIRGTVIELFGVALDEHHRPQFCGPPAITLAHEIGHFLGLRDAPLGCYPHLMAPIPRHGTAERRVDREICAAVSGLWRVARELAPGRSGADGAMQEPVAGREE